MNFRLLFLAVLLTLVLMVPAWVAADDGVSLQIDPETVVHRIDPKVYGHFLEHIYHSVNGGLWGEMIWNRSFEQWPGRGQWTIEDGQIVQHGLQTGVRLTFGEPAWKDYDLTVEAKKTGGREGFLVLFRVVDAKNFYWLNLGGWDNRRHGLERADAGQRQRPVAPMVEGSIETGRWYKIRVRCEGPRVQAWLDGRQILDFTDAEGAHLTGCVGVGTWATQARFRKLKVVSLDGKPLLDRVTRLAPPTSVATYWRSYGPARCSPERDNPWNSECAQAIESGGVEAGVAQSPLCIRRGESYYGSLWVRGRVPEGLIVRLVDGETRLARAELPAPTSQWQEYRFELKSAADAENATIEIGLRGEGRIALDQVSLMSAASRATGGYRPDLLEAVAALKPPIIRWPGGCFASAYRWKDGIGPQHRRVKYPREIWDDIDVNSYGTDEFVAMCRKVGAEPLIVVNIGTPSWNPGCQSNDFLQETLDWIEYCNGPATSAWGKVRAANGHPEPYNVKYWEIDNETWHVGAEKYVEYVRRFAPAMRRADPTIKLAVCGSGGCGNHRNGLPWNRAVIEGCAEWVDYLSIHHYENPGRFAEGPGAYEAFFRETARLIANSANPGMKLYCSEWNAQSTDWRTGLYAGGLLNAFERCGDVFEIGGPALFLRHVSATAWDNAFINFDHRTWFPGPNYVVMKLWHDHYAPNRVALEGDCGQLNAVATLSEDKAALIFKVVNPANKSVPLKLSVANTFPIASATSAQIAPGALDARNTLGAPAAIRPVRLGLKTEGQSIQLTLPRWSVTVVRMERAPRDAKPSR